MGLRRPDGAADVRRRRGHRRHPLRPLHRGDPLTKAPGSPRLDRRILAGNLVSGAGWLTVLLVLTRSPALVLLAAVYVALVSVFLAAVYAQRMLTWRQEASAWATAWLLTVVAWAWLVGAADGTPGVGVLPLLHGLWLGALTIAVWQASALAVRQLLGWRTEAGRAS